MFKVLLLEEILLVTVFFFLITSFSGGTHLNGPMAVVLMVNAPCMSANEFSKSCLSTLRDNVF